MDLEEYISTTRTISDKEPTLREYYVRYYGYITAALGNNIYLPNLKVVYTLQRSTEIISLSGTHFLIYDQYFGQTMNMFNRILLNSNSPAEAEMYFMKLIAEGYAIKGNLELASLFGYTYRIMKDKYDSYKQDKDAVRRGFFTLTQELFIIAHEIAHLMIEEPHKFPELLRGAITDGPYPALSPKFSQIIHAIAEFLSIESIDYDGVDLPLENSSSKAKGDKQPARTEKYPHLIDGLFDKTDIDNRVECFCDVVAAMIIASVMRSQRDDRLGDMFLGIAMGLRHLRLLGIINDICSGAWVNHDKNMPHYMIPYIVRASNLRSFVSVLMKAMGREEGATDMIDLAEHYETILDDPLLFEIPEKHETLVKGLKARNTTSNQKKKLTVRLIGEITGFYN